MSAHACPEHGRKPPCQDTKFAAAASTGDVPKARLTSAAVRGRSAVSLPRGAIPDPAAERRLVLSACTPTRWLATNLVGQGRSPDGPGGTVASVTSLQPRRYQHHYEIVGQSCEVAGLQISSRVMRLRVRVCGSARTYARKNLQPCNLSYIPHIIHRVIGNRKVAKRLQLQPALACAVAADGKAPEFNKVVGGYAEFGCASTCPASMKGRKGGRGRKTFGLGARGRIGAAREAGSMASARLEVDRPARSGWAPELASSRFDQGGGALGRNGGNLPFLGCAAGRVGTAMSERMALSRRNARFLERRRQLARLTVAASGGQPGRGSDQGASRSARRPRGGGGPPSAARLVPRPFAPAIFSNSDRASIALQHDRSATLQARAQASGPQTGSGEARLRPGREARGAGQGRFSGLEVRRFGDPSAGVGHVN